jgi:hypothetical protein
MKNLLLAINIAILPLTQLSSQDPIQKEKPSWVSSLRIESGLSFPSGAIKDHIAIRQNVSSYHVNQYNSGQVFSETTGFMAGVRWDLFNPRLKAGISAGLRYSNYFTDITGYSAHNSDFFYLRYSETGDETKFARVTSITERKDYLSIPVELTYTPIQFRHFGFFVRGGAEIGINGLQHKTDVNFREHFMNEYKGDILAAFGETSKKPLSKLYGTIGVIYKRTNKTSFMFEGILPSIYLTESPFTLTDVDCFYGLSFSVLIPIMKNAGN